MASITKATVKKFIDQNRDKLFIKIDNKEVPAIICDTKEDGNYGVAGVWFAPRNKYIACGNEIYKGFKIMNHLKNSFVLIKR